MNALLQSLFKDSPSDVAIVADHARSHASEIKIVKCQRRQIAQNRRDEGRWSSIPADLTTSNTNHVVADKVNASSSNLDTKQSCSSERPAARQSLSSILVKPVRQISIKQLQTEKLPCVPKSGKRRTLEKTGSNRRLRLSRQASREFIHKQQQQQQQGRDRSTSNHPSNTRITLKVSSHDLKAILASGVTGSSGPLRIPIRQRSIRTIECTSSPVKEKVTLKDMKQLSNEFKTRMPQLLHVPADSSPKQLSPTTFQRKKTNTLKLMGKSLFETVNRDDSILSKQ